jgi:glycosyltransferase involved in cell wall biosynthesis
MPLVSVVIAVHNGAGFIDRALPSILKQSFSDWELIVVDDGSTDDTPELLLDASRKECRIRVLSPGRVGFANALNLGIREAQGDYIARQDFDDTSSRDRLAIQVEYLNRNPSVGMVGGHYIIIDENRRERYVRRPPETHELIIRAMASHIPFAHTVVTFRKSAWEQVGGYPLAGNCVDLRMWLRFAAAGWKLGNVPAILGEHFVYAGSFWHKNYKYVERQRDLASVQQEVIRQLGLPKWYLAYPYARLAYARLPDRVKRFVRRKLMHSREEDLSGAGAEC